MAGIEPEIDAAEGKPNPVRPGDRWITRTDAGQPVERTRNAAGDGWDEVLLASDMPLTLARAHELLIALHVENGALRQRQTPAREPAPTIAQRAATMPSAIVSRPCGGCGKTKP